MTVPTNKSVGSIKKSVARGAVLMVLFRTLDRSLGLISTMILARILVPDDYGIIAMAMSFYALIAIMAAMGFDVLLIQKDEVDKSHYDSAWSLKLVFYTVLSMLLYSVAPYVATFYEEPRLTAVIHVLSVGMFLVGLENIKMVDFRRNLEFKKEFWFHLGVKLSGFVVTVPLAFILGNYWALVAGMITYRTASLVLSYALIPYKPSICFSKVLEFYHFSKWLILANILKFLDMNMPSFILGKLLGARPLGIYSLSSEIAYYPSTELCAPINRALFPGYSRLKDNPGELRKTYLDVLGILALIVLPIGIGVSATAEYVVAIILGGQWTDAVEPLQILAIAFTFTALGSNSSYIYYALGHPQISFYTSLVRMILLAPLLIYLASHYGLYGAAMSYLIVCCITPLIHYGLIAYLLKLNFLKILSVQLRPLLSVAIMYVVLHTHPFQVFIAEQVNVLVSMLVAVVLGAIIYGIMTLLLWRVFGGKGAAEIRAIDLTMSLLGKN